MILYLEGWYVVFDAIKGVGIQVSDFQLQDILGRDEYLRAMKRKTDYGNGIPVSRCPNE